MRTLGKTECNENTRNKRFRDGARIGRKSESNRTLYSSLRTQGYALPRANRSEIVHTLVKNMRFGQDMSPAPRFGLVWADVDTSPFEELPVSPPAPKSTSWAFSSHGQCCVMSKAAVAPLTSHAHSRTQSTCPILESIGEGIAQN